MGFDWVDSGEMRVVDTVGISDSIRNYIHTCSTM